MNTPLRKNSLIEFYLQKVAQGEENFMGKLCRQLASRLVYVPVLTIECQEGKETCRVLTIKDELHESVPVFTTKEKFDLWCVRGDRSLDHLDILGADLCQTLGADIWLTLDSGFGNGVELSPEMVSNVLSTDPEEIDEVQVKMEASQEPEEVVVEELPLTDTEAGLQTAVFTVQDKFEVLEVNQQLSAEPPVNQNVALAESKDNYLNFLSQGAKGAFGTLPQDLESAKPAEENGFEDGSKKKKSFLNFLTSGRVER